MNKPSTEIWNKSLLTLDDSVFFHVFKNFLGKIETPFNKHSLIARVNKLFLNEETITRLIDLMDRKDKQILSSLYRLTFPSKRVLETYLEQDFSFTEFHMLIQNLEERLVIFEYEDRLYINPLLFDPLYQSVLTKNWNIEKSVVSFAPESQPWLTELRVFGILSCMFHSGTVMGKQGEIKKKTLSKISSTVFTHSEDESINEMHEQQTSVIVDIIKNLGFLSLNGSEAVLKISKLKDFGTLSLMDRVFYFWAGFIRFSAPDTGLPGLKNLTETLSSFLHSLEHNTGYTKKSLYTILGEIDLDLTLENKIQIVDTLIQLAVITSDGDWYGISPMIVLNTPISEPDGVGSIIFSSSLQFTLQNNYSYEALLLCSCTALCVQADYFAQFEISKRSLHKGAVFFEDPVIDLYKKYSPSITQSTCFTIEQWTEQMDDIALYSGITIAVKERHIPFFNSLSEKLAIRQITNGIYICDIEAFSYLEQQLEDHDIYIPGIVGTGDSNFSFSSRLTKFTSIKPSPVVFSELEGHSTNPPDFLDSLYQALGSSQLNSKEKAEIEEKIKSKLILYPEQINKHICRKDKVEARGIDFQGKLNLIQQALKNREDLLSVQYFTDDFDTAEHLVLPVKLAKENNQYILEGQILPDEVSFTKDISQLSRVRRIRKSLYTF